MALAALLEERQRSLDARCDQVSRRWQQLGAPPPLSGPNALTPTQPLSLHLQPPLSLPAPPQLPVTPSSGPSQPSVPAVGLVAPAPAAPTCLSIAATTERAQTATLGDERGAQSARQALERRQGAALLRALQRQADAVLSALEPPPPPPSEAVRERALAELPEAAADALPAELAGPACEVAVLLAVVREGVAAQRRQLREGYQESLAVLKASLLPGRSRPPAAHCLLCCPVPEILRRAGVAAHPDAASPAPRR